MTQLANLGAALFGAHWRAPMARALRVDRRTVERWEAGDHPVPAGVFAELTEHLRQHHARIVELLNERRDGK